MLTTFINTLMSAEADAVCAAYGEPSPQRVNIRYGYRHLSASPETDPANPPVVKGSICSRR